MQSTPIVTSNRSVPVIAFLGTGLMGKGIIRNLLTKTNAQLQIYARNRPAVLEYLTAHITEEQFNRVQVYNQVEQCSVNAQWIILCLTEDEVIRNLVLKTQLVDNAARNCASGYLIDVGTTSLEMTYLLQKKAQDLGWNFIDAPMTGSKLAAEQGQIVFMVGASEADREKCDWIFNATGKAVVLCGAAGKGQKIKQVLNLVQAGLLQVYCEGLMLAQKLGINSEQVHEVLSLSAARSGLWDAKFPKIKQRDFSPHFSVKNMGKDVKHALKLSQEVGAILPLAQKLAAIYEEGERTSLGEEDFSALIKINELYNVKN